MDAQPFAQAAKNSPAGNGGRFLCSSATIDITPPMRTALAGSGEQNLQWSSIESRLQANAMVLSCEKQRILFIAADILYFGPELVKAIESYAKTFAIPAEAIVLTASHTHYAPAADSTKPLLGEYSPEYNDFLLRQMQSLVGNLHLSAPVPVRICTSRMETRLNVNRRRQWPLPTLTRMGLTFRPIVLAPAPDMPRDEFIDVIKMVAEDGVVVCVAWKFACHPVCYPGGVHVSAEFPGRARERLRAELGESIPVLYWQGFAGDVRPNLLATPSWKDRISAIRRGPRFGTPSLEQWENWSNEVAKAFVACVRSAGKEIDAGLSITATAIPLSKLIEGGDRNALEGRAMSLKRVYFEGQLAVVFIGAEVCTPYLSLLRSDVPTIFVGYSGEVFGYLPTAQQVREGGYEGGEFFQRFGLRGKMCSDLDATVVEAARRLQSSPFTP